MFWRARPCADDPWPSLADMWAPPKEYASSGRFNDAAASLLYTSLREETTLAEICAGVRQKAQVIGYRTILGQSLRLAVIGELMHVHKLGYMRFTGSDPNLAIARQINELGVQGGRDVIYIDAFLQSLLADTSAKKNEYIFTRAIASMIHRDAEIDGIAFQSARDPLGYNVVLRPDAAAKKIHATCCFQCQVNAIREFGFIEFTTLRDAVRLSADSKFEWEKPLPESRRRFFNLTKEEYNIAKAHRNDPNAFLAMTRAHR